MSGLWATCLLTVLSAALRGYVRLTASLSVSSCLGLTLWLTDALINHHGQGGLMRLVISLIPVEKNSLLGWETLSLNKIWFWFTSIYFNHLLTGTLGLEGGYPRLFFLNSQGYKGACFSFVGNMRQSILSFIRSHRSWLQFCKQSRQHLQKTKGRLQNAKSPKVLMMNFKSSRALVFSPAAAQLCHVELSSNNNVWTQHRWADRQGRGRMRFRWRLPTNKRSWVDVVNGPTGPIILPQFCNPPTLQSPPILKAHSLALRLISLLDSGWMEMSQHGKKKDTTKGQTRPKNTGAPWWALQRTAVPWSYHSV